MGPQQRQGEVLPLPEPRPLRLSDGDKRKCSSVAGVLGLGGVAEGPRPMALWPCPLNEKLRSRQEGKFSVLPGGSKASPGR